MKTYKQCIENAISEDNKIFFTEFLRNMAVLFVCDAVQMMKIADENCTVDDVMDYFMLKKIELDPLLQTVQFSKFVDWLLSQEVDQGREFFQLNEIGEKYNTFFKEAADGV